MKCSNFISPLIFISILISICDAQYIYPATKIVDSSHYYFGVTYKDPYQWLENLNDPNTISWFKQQANYTDSIMNRISGRDELIAQWKRLDSLQPPSFIIYYQKKDRTIYTKRMPGELVRKLYYRNESDKQEHLLFDPTGFIKGKTLSLQEVMPSSDGRKIAISYAESGREISTVRIIDVDDNILLPDIIYPTMGLTSWTPDHRGFLYLSLKSSDVKDLTRNLNNKSRLHIIGDSSARDLDFFSNESYPDLGIKAREVPQAWIYEDCPGYVFGSLNTVQTERLFYYAAFPVLNSGKLNWKVLCNPNDMIVNDPQVIGGFAYGITYKNAKNYKLVRTSLASPDWNHAEIIGPEKPDRTLTFISHSRDFIFINYSDGINSHLSKYNIKDRTTQEIKLPYPGLAEIKCLDPESNRCIVTITSWNKPNTEFDYNAENDLFLESAFNKPAVYPSEYQHFIAEEVEVRAPDGQMIPLSIVYREGLKRDGSNICMLNGYGAYGISSPPVYSTLLGPLIARGVVLAVAHVRGGGEKGQDWHKGGFKTTKPNTWKDFNACAEYLIDKKFTSAKKLCGRGTSAGGILISRAITSRPDLYAVAVCNVGDANTMRLEFRPDGPMNIPEFGTVQDSIECRALFEMDGVLHVRSDTKYPAVLCVGGWNDPRVPPWQPGKFAAALQQCSNSGKPVLMKVNYNSGHLTEDRSVIFANFADQYSFIMWQCGDKNFQLK